MSDLKKDEDEKQAIEDFASGFTGDPALEKAADTQEKPEAKSETPTKVEAVKTKAEPEPPEYIQITKADWESLQGAASKMVTPEKVKDIVGGTVGELEQRIVRKLQAATPSGASVEIPADAFDEMAKDYPELAAQMKRAIEKSLKGVRGTGAASAKAEPDAEAISKIIEAEAEKMAEKVAKRREIEAIEEEYENWRDIVGKVDNDGKPIDPDNAFRKWLAAQGKPYETRINRAKRAATIIRAIERFEASKAALTKTPVTPKPNQQADRIRAAVQPKGDGGQPPPAKTADDDFRSGFLNG